MSLSYQRRYNADVVARGEAFDTEGFTYLDEHVKDEVIVALHDCLVKRPADPAAFIARTVLKTGSTAAFCVDDGEGVDASPVGGAEGDSSQTVPNTPETDGYQLYVEDGVACELKPMRQHARPVERIAGLPVASLVAPTVYEIESALRVLCDPSKTTASATPPSMDLLPSTDRSAPMSSVLLVVEPPPCSQGQVVFVKGIPYLTGLAHTLLKRRRQQLHAQVADEPASLPTGSHATTGETQPSAEAAIQQRVVSLFRATLCDDVVGFEEHFQSTVQEGEEGLQPTLAHGSVPPCEVVLSMLPTVQQTYYAVYESIDKGFARYMKTVESSGRPSVPRVLFVSYNVDGAALTAARVLSAFVPYYETAQLAHMSQMTAESRALIAKYSVDYCAEYWRGVHQRREEEDATGEGGRRGAGGKTNGKRRLPMSSSNVAASVTAGLSKNSLTGSSVLPSGSMATAPMRSSAEELLSFGDADRGSPNGMQSLSAMTLAVSAAEAGAAFPTAQRRQMEDTAFLEVVHQLHARSATRIQCAFRGYRVRKALQEARGHARGQNASGGAMFSLALPYPSSVPPLLRLVAESLAHAHGELFGNYAPSPAAEPRREVYFCPSRNLLLPAGRQKGESKEQLTEAARTLVEQWTPQTLFIFPRRSAERLPHFNPVRRVLEYYRLAGCQVLQDAMYAQRQLTGFSVSQRRAYNLLKSIALDILHVAYVELSHRGYALGDVEGPPSFSQDTGAFSQFVSRYHAEVEGWFSRPHLVSCAAQNARVPLIAAHGSSDDGLVCGSTAMGAVTGTRVNVWQDHVLVPSSAPTTSAHHSSPLPVFTRVADNLYVTRTALPAPAYAALARHLTHAGELGSAPGANVPKSGAGEKTELRAPVSQAATRTAECIPGADATARREVSLINLCPYPTVYLGGRAYLLAPRREAQTVEGRAGSAQFVLREAVVEESACGAQRSHGSRTPASHAGLQQSNAPRAEGALGRQSTATESNAFTAIAGSLSGVTMESEERFLCNVIRTELSTRGAVTAHRGGGSASAHAALTETVQSLLEPTRGYEEILAENALVQKTVTVGELMQGLFGVPGADVDLPESAAQDHRATLQSDPLQAPPQSTARATRTGEETAHAQAASQLTGATAVDSAGQTSPSTGASATPEKADTVPLSDAVRGSGGVPSSRPTVAALLDVGTSRLSPEEVARTSSPSSQLHSRPCTASPTAAQRQEDSGEECGADVDQLVLSSGEMARTLGEVYNANDVNVRYVHPWMPTGLSGRLWLRHLNDYLSYLFTELQYHRHRRAGAQENEHAGAVVLAAPAPHAPQTIYVVSAILLSRAMERTIPANPAYASSHNPQTLGEQEESDMDGGSAGAAERQLQQHQRSGPPSPPASLSYLPSSTPPSACFVDSFCALLAAKLPSEGVHVAHCVDELCSALQTSVAVDNNVDGVCSLEGIGACVMAAQTEPAAESCEQYILAATRLTEHFCWLLLLQVFLALPTTQTQLKLAESATLPPFVSFVTGLDGVLEWMATVDPWRGQPASCPDVTHVRYSNGLRRWDNTDYVCFAAR